MKNRTNNNSNQVQGPEEHISEPVQSKAKYVEISLVMASPLLLIVLCPSICFMIYFSQYANITLLNIFTNPSQTIAELAKAFPDTYPTVRSFTIIWSFLIFEFLLLKFVPGKIHHGPVSPAGIRPTYKQNGMACYVISVVGFLFGSLVLKLFSPTLFYDNFGPITSTVSISALLICALLVIKGRTAPSGPDNTVLGGYIANYFWGIELYPYLFGVSLKQLINCRFGMMIWNIVILSYALKQYELQGFVCNSMVVSVALQSFYIAKFFYWECGYFGSIDIMHDRFGFMLCWGCMCWITGFYTSGALWLVNHPVNLPTFVAIAIFIFGVLNIWINYDADRQRQEVRETSAKCTVWGQKPKTLMATYTTKDGKQQQNLLLYSGWWGLARHFHYVPELLLSLAWALPAGFSSPFPYSYLFYLTILLFDRANRDEKRCSAKYGKHWEEYRKLVPSKIVPFIY